MGRGMRFENTVLYGNRPAADGKPGALTDTLRIGRRDGFRKNLRRSAVHLRG